MVRTLNRIRLGLFAGAALAIVLGLTVFGSPGTAEATQPVEDEFTIQASCGDKEDVDITGGEAHWTITCANGKTTISGWHKDLSADGYCIQVYGSVAGESFITPRACPEGEREIWSRTLDGTTSISVNARRL